MEGSIPVQCGHRHDGSVEYNKGIEKTVYPTRMFSVAVAKTKVALESLPAQSENDWLNNGSAKKKGTLDVRAVGKLSTLTSHSNPAYISSFFYYFSQALLNRRAQAGNSCACLRRRRS